MTREEAIMVLQKIKPTPRRADGKSTNHALEMIALEMAIKALEQEPKTGHWEWVQYDYNPKLGNWHCSECRCVVVECVDKNEKGGIPLYKYCPQCGAKMVEPQAESKEKTCKNCINAKECVMYEPNMKRCNEYKADPKEIYNRGFADGQKALAEHLKLCKEELLDKIKDEIAEEKEHAYADFERYKVEYLGQDWEDAIDSLPQDDFRYGMERCIEIIDEYRAKREGEQEIKKGGEHG